MVQRQRRRGVGQATGDPPDLSTTPYNIVRLSLTSARDKEELQVGGDFVRFWTDGTLSGVQIRIDRESHDAINLDEHNGFVYSRGFKRLYLTNSAQSGKSLSMFISRGISAGGPSAFSSGITAVTRSPSVIIYSGRPTATSTRPTSLADIRGVPNWYYQVVNGLNVSAVLYLVGSDSNDIAGAGDSGPLVGIAAGVTKPVHIDSAKYWSAFQGLRISLATIPTSGNLAITCILNLAI